MVKSISQRLPQQQRIRVKSDQNKLKATDIIPLVNMIFLPVHKDRLDVNLRTMAKTGVSPFTQILLIHPEVLRTGKAKAQSVQEVTDAALLALCEDSVNMDTVGVAVLRKEAETKRKNLNKSNMVNEILDDDADNEGMTEEERELQRATDESTAKGGSMFLEAMRLGIPEGIEYTSDLIRGIALRTATSHLEATKKKEATAKLKEELARINVLAGRPATTKKTVAWKGAFTDQAAAYAREREEHEKEKKLWQAEKAAMQAAQVAAQVPQGARAKAPAIPTSAPAPAGPVPAAVRAAPVKVTAARARVSVAAPSRAAFAVPATTSRERASGKRVVGKWSKND